LGNQKVEILRASLTRQYHGGLSGGRIRPARARPVQTRKANVGRPTNPTNEVTTCAFARHHPVEGTTQLRIHAGFEISYECPAPTAMTLLLSVRPERLPDLLTPQHLAATPNTLLHPYRDLYGNAAHRLVAPAGVITFSAEFVIEDSGEPDPVLPAAVQHPVEALPAEVLLYLLGSRYCETDLMTPMAWSLFGNTPDGWARVQAIVDYVHSRIEFGYPHADPTRGAFGANDDRRGVCRDFAHLSVTLCRCMNIPARYVTGYLGDIGVPPIDAPMDFSAWFEVYLGGGWRAFDARHNRPRIGRIAMAYGRDAADAAITTSFGPVSLKGFKVVTEEVIEEPVAVRRYG
jgi:transglutaminase-like putative cysteine protease